MKTSRMSSVFFALAMAVCASSFSAHAESVHTLTAVTPVTAAATSTARDAAPVGKTAELCAIKSHTLAKTPVPAGDKAHVLPLQGATLVRSALSIPVPSPSLEPGQRLAIASSDPSSTVAAPPERPQATVQLT